LLGRLGLQLQEAGQRVDHLDLRGLPPGALLGALTADPAIAEALARVEAADTLILATPVYKAAYSGLLKTFLDLLPQDGLHGKTVLPVVTGGSLAHMLVIDYALRPVLAALGAGSVLPGIFAVDAQIAIAGEGVEVEAALQRRIDEAVERLCPTPPLARQPDAAWILMNQLGVIHALPQPVC
jgi:FMN reductase